MENVVELKREETIPHRPVSLGFIGWGMFGQGLQSLQRTENSSRHQKGWIFPLDDLPEESNGWKIVLDLDHLFSRANVIFVDAAYEDLKLLFPRIRLLVSDSHLLVFLGADVSFKKISEQITERKVIRCLVSPVRRFLDISLVFAASQMVSAQELEQFFQVLDGLPVVLEVDSESQLEALQGLISTGPAIGYSIIDALADGALKMQIPRKTGLLLAAHVLFGAARTFLESEIHPGVLRDQSITQKGIPLSGLVSLEKSGFRGSIVQAIEEAANEAQKKSRSE
ncbi:MAG: hypothetical protein HQM13_20120 [SAR324 cluster bacterium]|nr:hypothetical protein [SAR324 cluster bacterium]